MGLRHGGAFSKPGRGCFRRQTSIEMAPGAKRWHDRKAVATPLEGLPSL
jgi:hypothetical protein